jgi:Flp pilus assembly protein TadG
MAKKEKGFTLVGTSVAALTVVFAAGLAVDVGRMYIAKSEVQAFCDSAALAATLELDGTTAGITRAEDRVKTNVNRWNFGTRPFSTSSLSYAKDATGPWETTVADPRGYRYARLSATVDVPLTFMSVFARRSSQTSSVPLAMFLTASPTAPVVGDSAGGQEAKTGFRHGLFPFSPFAHSTAGPHFGLTVGQQYTLRWPSNPRRNANVCAGDNAQTIIDLAQAGGGEERGFIEESSASVIRAAIEDDYQTVFRSVGDTVFMSGGAKQSQLDSLIHRINQDTDRSAATYSEYVSRKVGNGRRLVAVPINTGSPDYRIVQIGAFFLLPTSEYRNGGNFPFCAEYAGSWLQGSWNRAASDSGAYVARLVR